MAEKFIPRHSVGSEIRRKDDNSKFVNEFLSTAPVSSDASVLEFKQVPLDQITPRLINKYRQSRIEQLAASIRNTNNRLIHPIVLVRASDLPANHEVRKQIEAQGRSVADYQYIIVSGERRFRAWQLLRRQEAERIGKKIGVQNPFDTITANILTRTEALNERSYYSDANNQARHLSPAEGVWFIKDALKEVSTNEQKRDALILLNGGSDIGIDLDPAKAARHFRVDQYCRKLLDDELGVTDWSDATLRNMATVAQNCTDSVADALLSGSFPLREAKNIASLPANQQEELLNLFLSDRSAYDLHLSMLRSSSGHSHQKVTHADTRRQLKSTLKRVMSERDALESISKGLGSKYNRNELDAIKRYDAFISDLAFLIDNTK